MKKYLSTKATKYLSKTFFLYLSTQKKRHLGTK
jgi:hypothetical protein